jgi:hypothetical protein
MKSVGGGFISRGGDIHLPPRTLQFNHRPPRHIAMRNGIGILRLLFPGFVSNSVARLSRPCPSRSVIGHFCPIGRRQAVNFGGPRMPRL